MSRVFLPFGFVPSYRNMVGNKKTFYILSGLLISVSDCDQYLWRCIFFRRVVYYVIPCIKIMRCITPHERPWNTVAMIGKFNSKYFQHPKSGIISNRCIHVDSRCRKASQVRFVNVCRFTYFLTGPYSLAIIRKSSHSTPNIFQKN